MRKVVLLAALLALLVAVALPAFADKGHNDGKDRKQNVQSTSAHGYSSPVTPGIAIRTADTNDKNCR